MNWWLILIAVVVSILIVGISVYFVILFCADVDKGTAWFPKVVVVFGLTLSIALLLLLPFDVAARTDPTSVRQLASGKINTEVLWQIVLWTIACMIIVVIPFTTFYYEGADPDHHSAIQQIGPAILYTFCFIVVAGVLFALLWLTAGYADLPYISYATIEQWQRANATNLVYAQSRTIQFFTFQVSLFVYVAALIAFFGWILFLIFGSVGLTALPYDYFHSHMTRPQPISSEEFEAMKGEIATNAEMLLKEVDKLHKEQLSRNNASVRRKIDALKIEVYELQDDFNKKKDAADPTYLFWTIANGLVGILCFLLTVFWMLHILIYLAIDLNDFLNTMLLSLDAAFPLLGTIAYALFAFYLLWCSVKGCLKVGMRIACVTIHPMKVGDTLMNAMLFNTGLILLTSVTVATFTAMAFDKYVQNTTIGALMNTFIRNVRGLGVAMFYFQYVFPLLALLCAVWVILCPKSPKPESAGREPTR